MRRKKELTYEQEVIRIAEMYRTSDLQVARDCYEDYINLILIDLPKYERNGLRNLWEDLKND